MVYIGFSTTNSFISKLIRKITNSSVSHSFITLDLMNQEFIIDSDWMGITIKSYKDFLNKNQVVKLILIPYSNTEVIVNIYDYLGKSYDYGGLFGNIFVLIGRWLRRKWHNPLQNSRALFCSEFIVNLLQRLKYNNSENLVPQDTNPQDLLDFLNSNKEF